MKKIICLVMLLLVVGVVAANQAPKITNIRVSINDVEISGWKADGYIADLFWQEYGIYCPIIYCLNSCGVWLK